MEKVSSGSLKSPRIDMNVAAATVKGMEDDWPSDIEDEYERIRPLGEGGFGKVWLAKKKTVQAIAEEKDTQKNDEEEYVAIKQIAIKRQIQDHKFVAREVAILSELYHPNIIRCLHYVDMPCSTLVVLTLAYGPNLGDVVRLGGALSVSLARLVSRQLISAVAYLHGRGVIHRDIKPDNCILTRCGITSAQYDLKDATSWKVDDNLWDDEAIFNEKEWRMKLVDFGFARALTPAECGVLNGHQRRPSMSELIQRGITNEKSRRSSLGIEGGDGAVLEDTDDAAINDTSSKLRRKSILFTRRSNSLEEEETMPADDSSSSRRRKSSLFGRKRLNSIEKNLIRAMSALGTLDYAAPEIKNSRDKCDGDVALTDLVADYGLIADAYSVGCTIREILTGVPAKEAKNEMDFMTSHGNSIDFLALFFSCCTTTASNSSNRRKKRKRRYKWLDESPKHARELVLKMINTKIADRLTVPLAREEVWIKGGMSSDDPIVTLPVGDIPAGVNDSIEFLQFTTTMEYRAKV